MIPGNQFKRLRLELKILDRLMRDPDKRMQAWALLDRIRERVGRMENVNRGKAPVDDAQETRLILSDLAGEVADAHVRL